MARATPTGGGVALPPSTVGGQRLKLILAAAVLGAALVYFAFTAFESAKVYYLTVGEVLAQTSPGEVVRANGKLVPESFQRNPGETLAYFSLADGDQTLQVQYDGVVSDLFFNPHSEIVAEGTYQGEGVFHATDILVKCPSKYVAAQES